MSDRLMWSARMSYEDWLIGTFDEIDIEARAHDIQSFSIKNPSYLTNNNTILKEFREHIFALRRIDELHIDGKFADERSRLSDILSEESRLFPNKIDISDEDMEKIRENGKNFENIYMGLRSICLDQRARFQKFYEEQRLDEKSVPETAALIAVIERAKLPKGRPRLSPPWREVVNHLDRMRELCVRGSSIPQAAMDVARAEGKASGQENRAKLFERRYRERVKLREIKS